MDILQSHFVIRSRDFDRSTRFYDEVLALPRLVSWDREDGRGACFQAGTAVVEIRGRSRGGRGPLGELGDQVFDYTGPDHKLTLTFIVPSAEAAYEELQFRERNIPGGLRKEVDGRLAFETHDPDGVKIIFREG